MHVILVCVGQTWGWQQGRCQSVRLIRAKSGEGGPLPGTSVMADGTGRELEQRPHSQGSHYTDWVQILDKVVYRKALY